MRPISIHRLSVIMTDRPWTSNALEDYSVSLGSRSSRRVAVATRARVIWPFTLHQSNFIIHVGICLRTMETPLKRRRVDECPPLYQAQPIPQPVYSYARDVLQEIEALHAADNGVLLKQILAHAATQLPYIGGILTRE